MNITTYGAVDESPGLIVTISVKLLDSDELKAGNVHDLKWDIHETARSLTKRVQEYYQL